MSILKKLSAGTAGVIVITTTLVVDPAQAITFTSTPYSSAACPAPNSCRSSEAGITEVNFNDGNAPIAGFATYTPGGNGAIRSGNSPGQSSQYTAPQGDTTPYLALGAPGTPSAVTITFVSPVNYFGLYVGSLESSNSATFFTTGGSSRTISYPDSTQTSQYVNFFAENANENFTSVRLSSNRQTFESDNHAYRAAPVPEPLTILGSSMALGFGILMKKEYSRRRQNTCQEKVGFRN